MRSHAALLLALVLAAPAAAQHRVVVPVFALGLPGRGGNVWSSELWVTNPGDVPVVVDPPVLLPGRLEEPTPCLPPAEQLVVPPGRTVLWSAAELARSLGCPRLAVGALVVSGDGPFRIRGRMVNVGVVRSSSLGPLQGFGQDVPGVPLEDLLARPRRQLLPGMVWDPLACGPVRFDSYVGFANPSDEAVHVTLDVSGRDGEMLVRLGGRERALPARLTVDGRSWRQLHLEPAGVWPEVCGEPLPFDLVLTLDGPLAVYGSVVDRASQDPRTVLPVPPGG